MARLQWNHAATLSSISTSTDGKSIAVDFLNYQRLPKLQIRQGQVIHLLFDLLTYLAKLTRPDGSRRVIAENLLFKQQLMIRSSSRQRAPNLTNQDRILLALLSLFSRSETHRQICDTHQAIYPAFISQRIEET